MSIAIGFVLLAIVAAYSVWKSMKDTGSPLSLTSTETAMALRGMRILRPSAKADEGPLKAYVHVDGKRVRMKDLLARADFRALGRIFVRRTEKVCRTCSRQEVYQGYMVAPMNSPDGVVGCPQFLTPVFTCCGCCSVFSPEANSAVPDALRKRRNTRSWMRDDTIGRHVHELLQSRLDLLLSVHSRRRAERLAALDAEIALLKSLVRPSPP